MTRPMALMTATMMPTQAPLLSLEYSTATTAEEVELEVPAWFGKVSSLSLHDVCGRSMRQHTACSQGTFWSRFGR